MLEVTGEGVARTCDGLTRRDFLQVGTLGAVGLNLAQLEALRRLGAAEARDRRSVIMIFNLGAPSHLDTFDPKPDAASEIRGPFRPIRTRSSEFRVSELFPRHAKIADKFSLVRSCHHEAAAVHDTGHQLMQTGRLCSDGIHAPHAGCVLAFLRGQRAGLPAHVVLPREIGNTGGGLYHGQSAGFLGRAYDPFMLSADPSRDRFAATDDYLPDHIGEVRLADGQPLRHVVDQTVRSFETSGRAESMDAGFAAAFRSLTSSRAREAFDLSRESAALRDRYGETRFGMSCLLARRLVEAGVRFVTINTFVTVFNEITWDIHGSSPFGSIRDMKERVAPMYDRAYAALIEDLDERGMLDDTLVCNLAEFGRTPRINPAGGRDHWPECWTVYFAGGGIQGGRAVGRSDEIGAFPAERPVEPAEVVATIYRSLGLDLATEIPARHGQPLPLVDRGIRPIAELF